MKLSALKFMPLLAGIMFLAGCMSFDYVGQSFEPRSDSAPVAIFQGRDRIPAAKYRIIGRGTLTGPRKTDLYDRDYKLRSEARSHGADAVCIVSHTVRAAGYYPQGEDTFSSPLAASSNVDNLGPNNQPWENDSFDKVRTLKNNEQVRYEFVTRVIFLKKIGDFNAEMKKRPSLL